VRFTTSNGVTTNAAMYPNKSVNTGPPIPNPPDTSNKPWNKCTSPPAPTTGSSKSPARHECRASANHILEAIQYRSLDRKLFA